MVNKSKKGNRKEKIARDMLIEQGWKIMFKSVRWRFGVIDFGQLFDIVAYKGMSRRYISCKHAGAGLEWHRKEIRGFKNEHGHDNESYELWTWYSPRWMGRGKNKIWFPGGFKTETIT